MPQEWTKIAAIACLALSFTLLGCEEGNKGTIADAVVSNSSTPDAGDMTSDGVAEEACPATVECPEGWL